MTIMIENKKNKHAIIGGGMVGYFTTQAIGGVIQKDAAFASVSGYFHELFNGEGVSVAGRHEDLKDQFTPFSELQMGRLRRAVRSSEPSSFKILAAAQVILDSEAQVASGIGGSETRPTGTNVIPLAKRDR